MTPADLRYTALYAGAATPFLLALAEIVERADAILMNEGAGEVGLTDIEQVAALDAALNVFRALPLPPMAAILRPKLDA